MTLIDLFNLPILRFVLRLELGGAAWWTSIFSKSLENLMREVTILWLSTCVLPARKLRWNCNLIHLRGVGSYKPTASKVTQFLLRIVFWNAG